MAADRSTLSPPSAPPEAPRLRARGIGTVAGLAAIGCCIYPVVLVLLGIATAAEAVALGDYLFGVWGWVFKLGGAALAIAAIAIQVRRRNRCRVDTPRTTLAGFAGRVAVVTVGVYFAVYGFTKWLSTLA